MMILSRSATSLSSTFRPSGLLASFSRNSARHFDLRTPDPAISLSVSSADCVELADSPELDFVLIDISLPPSHTLPAFSLSIVIVLREGPCSFLSCPLGKTFFREPELLQELWEEQEGGEEEEGGMKEERRTQGMKESILALILAQVI